MRISPELETQALELLASGETVTQVCRQFNIPFHHWYAHFADGDAFQRYARARLQQSHAMADKVIEAALYEPDVQRAKLLADNYKWRASKGNPAEYGDRLDLNVQRIDISTTLIEARARSRPICDLRNVIEAQVIEEEQEKIEGPTDKVSVAPAAPQSEDAGKNGPDELDKLMESIL